MSSKTHVPVALFLKMFCKSFSVCLNHQLFSDYG